MSSVPLILGCERPGRGPHVPLGRHHGKLVVSGLAAGNEVVLLGYGSGGEEVYIASFSADGEWLLALPQVCYLRVAYVGKPNPELSVYLQ